MLGLGNSIVNSSPISEGLISLDGGFTILSCGENPDDTAVQIIAGFQSEAMDQLLGYDGSNNSEGDQQGGTYTLRVARLDNSGAEVTGAISSGTVYLYRAVSSNGHNPFGLAFVSDDASIQTINGNPTADFLGGGDANIDLTSFGGNNIVDTGVTASAYKFTLTLSHPGYEVVSITTTIITINRP